MPIKLLNIQECNTKTIKMCMISLALKGMRKKLKTPKFQINKFK